MLCPRCDADVGGGARFCTACGLELRRLEPAATGAAPGLPGAARGGDPDAPPPQPRLVHCPSCEATNAASRRFCGRCGAWLRQGEQPPEVLLGPVDAVEPAPAPSGGRDSAVPATLVVVTVLATLVVVGVVLTILSARGIGLFAGPPEPTGPPPLAAVEVVEARSSSAVPPSGDVGYGAANLVDGDETTSWKEGVAGHGEGEWVELDLAEPVAVRRLLVYNGDQRPGRFAEYNRVARVRVTVGERTFTADLLDIAGPQAVDLPEPVTANRVRLWIVDVHQGTRYEDTSLSRVEVHAAPAPD